MKDLQIRILKWLNELRKHKDEVQKQRQIYHRYLDGKIEALEGVLEMMDEMMDEAKNDDM